MRRLWIVLLVLLVGWGAWSHWRHRAVPQSPGVLAPAEPEQVNLDQGAVLGQGDTTLTTRAHFDITARVLSRKDYSWGDDATLRLMIGLSSALDPPFAV